MPSEQETGGDSTLSRREVVWRLSMIVGGSVLAGCRRVEPETADATAAVPEVEASVSPAIDLPAVEPTIRVRVHSHRRAGRSVAIGSTDQWIRLEPLESTREPIVLRGPVEVRRHRSDGWTVDDHLGNRRSVPDGRPVELASIDPRSATLALGESEYPGSIRCVARADEGPEAFDLVNHVGLEAYLPGVLSKELFSHWHLQTFMAQAVTARSFACAEHAFYRDRRHYDVTSTTRSQVYAGHATHHRAVDGVAMTRGAVLAYQRGLVPGYYSSCCGGAPSTAIDAIGVNPINRLEPLQGRSVETACATSPVYSWTVELETRPLGERLAAWGRRRGIDGMERLSRLKSIDVVERNVHGRPIRHVIEDRRGTAVSLSAEQLRQAVNSAAGTILQDRRRLRSSNIEATVGNDIVTFEGRGFGHGVGLCQYGAEARARSGQSYEQIVEWYYPGAGLARGYT